MAKGHVRSNKAVLLSILTVVSVGFSSYVLLAGCSPKIKHIAVKKTRVVIGPKPQKIIGAWPPQKGVLKESGLSVWNERKSIHAVSKWARTAIAEHMQPYGGVDRPARANVKVLSNGLRGITDLGSILDGVSGDRHRNYVDTLFNQYRKSFTGIFAQDKKTFGRYADAINDVQVDIKGRIEEALKQAPSNSFLYVLKARLLIQAGVAVDNRKVMAKQIQRIEKTILAGVSEAEMSRGLQEHKQALKATYDASKDKSTDYYDKAVRAAKKAIKINPGSGSARLLLAEAYARRGECNTANKIIMQLHKPKVNWKNSSTFGLLAYCAMESGKASEPKVLKYLQEAIDIDRPETAARWAKDMRNYLNDTLPTARETAAQLSRLNAVSAEEEKCINIRKPQVGN